tara:strand:+ start:276 stop:1589 length:1314 start_codon:yes stop_codon:yes gene_type:complete
MGKKYLETKDGSLEQSVLGVWRDAIEESEVRMDGRTKGYKTHRAKLEAARLRRENKKKVVYEWALDLDDKEFNDILESMSDEEIIAFDEGIGSFIQKRTGLGPGGKVARAKHLKTKADKAKAKAAAIRDIDTHKATISKAKQDTKNYKAGKAGGDDSETTGPAGQALAKAKKKQDKQDAGGGATTTGPTEAEKEAKKNYAAAQAKYTADHAEWVKTKPEGKKDDEEADAFATRVQNWKDREPKKPDPPKKEEFELKEGSKEEYEKFFNKALKKFKINSPADLKSDEEKKKFFDYIDKNWTADHEESINYVKEFKVQSMRDALLKVWGIDENKLDEKPADFIRLSFNSPADAKKARKWMNQNLPGANQGFTGIDYSNVAIFGHIEFENVDDAEDLMAKLKKAGFRFKVDHREEKENGGKTLTGKKAAKIDLNPEIKDR